MTFAELVAKVAEAFPEGTIEQDLDGQLVIYTNLTLDGENVVSF